MNSREELKDPASKRYEIEKIADIFNVPEESIDSFLVDLKTYYTLGKSVPELIAEVAAISGVKTKTMPQKMVWIDDGKHDATIYLNPTPKDATTNQEALLAHVKDPNNISKAVEASMEKRQRVFDKHKDKKEDV